MPSLIEQPATGPSAAPLPAAAPEGARNEHLPTGDAAKVLGKPVATASRSLRAVELTAYDALRAIEPKWQALADEASEANPFLEPWALLPALEAFFPRGGFVVVAFDRQDPSGKKGERQLCGLFALERYRPAGPRGPSLWRSLKHPYLQLGTPLVREGMEGDVWEALFDWMEEGKASRSLIRIDELPAEGRVRAALTDVLYRRGRLPFVAATYTRAFFERAESADAYLEKAVGGRRRKEHRRLLARLSELGPVDVTELAAEEDPRTFADEFANLEAAGWKGRDEVSVRSQAEHERFFRELCRHAHLRGRLLATALRLSGKPVAMKLNLLSARGSVALKITYDESLAKFSPGVLLEVDNIRRLHARSDVPWMDSCAAPNRFMINQLWSERREVQSVLLSSSHPVGEAAVALFPAARLAKKWMNASVRKAKALLGRTKP